MCLTRPLSAIEIISWTLKHNIALTEQLMADCDSDEWKEGHYLFYMDKLKSCWENSRDFAEYVDAALFTIEERRMRWIRDCENRARKDWRAMVREEEKCEELLTENSQMRRISADVFFIDSCAEYGAVGFVKNIMKKFTIDDIKEMILPIAIMMMINATDCKLYSKITDSCISCIKNEDLYGWGRDKWTGVYSLKRTREIIDDAEIGGNDYWG